MVVDSNVDFIVSVVKALTCCMIVDCDVDSIVSVVKALTCCTPSPICGTRPLEQPLL